MRWQVVQQITAYASISSVLYVMASFAGRKPVCGANASDELVKKLHIHNKYLVLLSAYVLLVCLRSIVILQ